MVRDINLTEFEEHQLNNLDMIILASGVEGVVLKFIDHIDQTVEISNSSVSFIVLFIFSSVYVYIFFVIRIILQAIKEKY